MAIGTRRTLSKWRFFAAYWAVQGTAGALLWPLLYSGTKDSPRWDVVVSEPAYWAWVGAIVASLAGTQAALLLPVRAPRPWAGSRWSRWLRAMLAGFGVGACGGFVVAALFELADDMGIARSSWLGAVEAFWWTAGVLGVLAAAVLIRWTRGPAPALVSFAVAGLAGSVLLMGFAWAVLSVLSTVMGVVPPPGRTLWLTHPVVMLLASWPVTSLLVAKFLRRGTPESRLARLSQRMFVGTVIEAAALVPMDVMVRRKTDCYCGEGTLWGLTFCWGVGALVLGPAVWLIPLSKRRRRWHTGMRCPVCEYDMSACAGAERCPECGAGWKK